MKGTTTMQSRNTGVWLLVAQGLLTLFGLGYWLALRPLSAAKCGVDFPCDLDLLFATDYTMVMVSLVLLVLSVGFFLWHWVWWIPAIGLGATVVGFAVAQYITAVALVEI